MFEPKSEGTDEVECIEPGKLRLVNRRTLDIAYRYREPAKAVPLGTQFLGSWPVAWGLLFHFATPAWGRFAPVCDGCTLIYT